MTYGEMKEMVLQLLDRYSVAGVPVEKSYNNQADTLARIPAMTRDGLYYLTTTVRRLREVAELGEPEVLGDHLVYDLPEDCFQLAAGLISTRTGERIRDYRVLGGRQVLVPRALGTGWKVEYFRYPAVPVGFPEEDDFLDCPPEAQNALAYYVAAHLAAEDNPTLYTLLYGEFETRLARLREGVWTDSGRTADVYGLS